MATQPLAVRSRTRYWSLLGSFERLTKYALGFAEGVDISATQQSVILGLNEIQPIRVDRDDIDVVIGQCASEDRLRDQRALLHPQYSNRKSDVCW